MCTNDRMVPVNLLEANTGKKFSCYCGGGEDSLSQSACNAQGQYKTPTGAYNPDTGTPLVEKGATVTRFDWTFHGLGSSDSPGTISLAMNAGIHGNTWAELDTEEFKYFYPIVWSGTLDSCVITEGNCMDVYGTDVKDQQCYNYDCADTDISCPPAGLPECPGGPNDCGNIPGTDTKYQMQKCNVLPSSGIGFKISCLKSTNADGSYVCYYAQPGGYAPLSMTCSVGNCLYNDSAPIEFSDTKLDTPRGVAYQQTLLVVLVVSVMGAALGVELLRRGAEVRREKAFLEHSRRAQQRRRMLAGGAGGGGGDDDDDTTANPLLGDGAAAGQGGAGGSSSRGGEDDEDKKFALGKHPAGALDGPQASGGLALADGAAGAGVGAGAVGGGGRGRSESNDSGYDERRKYRGAVLSWQDMKLWVPAKASDQLTNLHAATKQGLEAFQRDLQQGLDLQNGLSMMDQVVRSPSSASPPTSPGVSVQPLGGAGGFDEEAGVARTAPVLLPLQTPGSPPPELEEGAGGFVGGGAPAAEGGLDEHSLEKQILRGVSGTARRGSMTALMGPSGAGKTSLLDCLAARKPMHRVQGLVTVNGRPCPPATMRNVSGYVAQHDVLPGVLTVREHLLFHARLRCPSSMGDLERRQRVHDVIQNLGLVKCADTVIGNEFKRGLSGGEKRRVSVAEELVVEPGILFLDEPTTGLDSTTAMSICKTLGDIARRGTTVLLSIHQPREDIFNLFDRVLVLCIGGRVVFEGPTALVPKYLRRAVEMDFVHDPKLNLFLAHHFNPLPPGPQAEATSEAGGAAAEGGKRAKKKKKKRLANPADLLLDVASCSKCNDLADAFGDQSFQEGVPDWYSALGDPRHPRGRSSSSSAKSQLTHHSEWEDALGPLVEEHLDFDDDEEGGGGASGCSALALDFSDDEQAATPTTALNGGHAASAGLAVPATAAVSSVTASSAALNGANLNYEDPNPVRALLNEAFMCCGLMRRPPVDDFFPPKHVASPLLQLAVLSERLVLTATRHPMLVLLQYVGALFLAVCLGFIFRDVPDDLYGVQDRFGLLFFLPFCLVLLGMSSLPVWRDEHILFTHEQGNKRIYGFPAYFLSVLLFDLILVRTVPPTFFAIITYNLVGLNQHCDECLLYFTFILILTNVISALIAMAVGAFRFSTSFSNLVGALLALLFALFAGFLVSKKGHKNLFVFTLDPMAYSYEALMINQFGNQVTNDGNEYVYVINGSWCAKGLETVYPTGNQLLSTFGFSNSQHDMESDIYALWTGALYCTALAFGVLVASAQAPYYSAAWQRMCQVSPLGLLAALVSAGFSALTGSGGSSSSGGGRGDALRAGGGGTEGNPSDFDEAGASLVSSSGGSLVASSDEGSGALLPSNTAKRLSFEQVPGLVDAAAASDGVGLGMVVNRARVGSGSDGSGSFEVPSEDEEEEEFPDKPRRRVVSFEDEDPEALAAARAQADDDEDGEGELGAKQGTGGAGGAAAVGGGSSSRAAQSGGARAAIAPSSSPARGGGGGGGAWPEDDEARRKALKALLKRQLRNPLGGDDAAGVRHNPDHLAPPMVLSFHNVCLSVPYPADLAKSLKRMAGSDVGEKEAAQLAASSSSASATEVVPLSATLDTGDVHGLGMNVVRSPQSGLAVVRKVMPGSWAQRKGVRPGDTVVGVGAVRVGAFEQLTPTLRAAPRPVRVHFLRRRRVSPQGGAASRAEAAAAARQRSLLYNRGAFTERAAKLGRLLGVGGTRYEPYGGPKSHSKLKPILKNVSGCTLGSHRVLKPLAAAPSSLEGPPQFRTLLTGGGSGGGGCDGSGVSAQADARAQAQAQAAVRANERLPAMVCGIMGPSGAGKTSLLDVLAGRKTVGTVTGVVRLNGRSMEPHEMRLLSGYVVQEDILPQMLTVRECLDFQARLRVPSSAPGGGPSGRVEAVLKRMKLVRTAGTVVGGSFQRGISGGEKRRLSVAIELLSEPAVLFLDEPTTGQDSTTAVMLCKALKKIARDGTTVVMSIHQPRVDIFEMMTQIVFMTREGRVAYCGPTAGLSGYIQDDLRMQERIASGLRLPGGRVPGGSDAKTSSNPADDLLDVMSVLEPQVLVDRYTESSAGAAQRAVLEVLAKAYFDPDDPDADDDGTGVLMGGSGGDGAVARASDRRLMKKLVAERGKHLSRWPAQFFFLSLRALRNTLRNPFPFFLHGVTAVVASVLIGFTFQDIHSKDDETAGTQDRFGIMFFLLLYLSLLSLTSLPLWRDDQQLFVAERGSGIYSTSAYVVSSMLFDVLPYRVLPPLAFALIAYPVIDLNDAPGHQFTFFFILFATNLTTSMICMLIGVLTASNAAANAAGSLAMLTSLLFCGYLLNKKRIPDGFEWILWWSPGNYAYEALVENEFQGLEELYITSVLAEEVIRAGPFTGANLAHCFGFEDRVGLDVWTLLVMAGVYFGGVLIVMELFIKEKR